jgi:hypothetical protein
MIKNKKTIIKSEKHDLFKRLCILHIVFHIIITIKLKLLVPMENTMPD